MPGAYWKFGFRFFLFLGAHRVDHAKEKLAQLRESKLIGLNSRHQAASVEIRSVGVNATTVCQGGASNGSAYWSSKWQNSSTKPLLKLRRWHPLIQSTNLIGGSFCSWPDRVLQPAELWLEYGLSIDLDPVQSFACSTSSPNHVECRTDLTTSTKMSRSQVTRHKWLGLAWGE